MVRALEAWMISKMFTHLGSPSLERDGARARSIRHLGVHRCQGCSLELRPVGGHKTCCSFEAGDCWQRRKCNALRSSKPLHHVRRVNIRRFVSHASNLPHRSNQALYRPLPPHLSALKELLIYRPYRSAHGIDSRRSSKSCRSGHRIVAIGDRICATYERREDHACARAYKGEWRRGLGYGMVRIGSNRRS